MPRHQRSKEHERDEDRLDHLRDLQRGVPASPDTIAKVVGGFYGVRFKPYTKDPLPRVGETRIALQILLYLLTRGKCMAKPMGLAEAARYVGLRSHSTALEWNRETSGWIAQNDLIEMTIHGLEREIVLEQMRRDSVKLRNTLNRNA